MHNQLIVHSSAMRRAAWVGVVLFAFVAVVAQARDAGSPFGAPVIKTRTIQRESIVNHKGELSTVVQTPQPVIQVQRRLEAVSSAQASGAQVVTLQWRRHGTYTIPIRVGNFSTLVMPKGSPIVQVAFSNPDAMQVSVNAPTNVIMVRLMQPISVPGTIVTKDRVYYVTIVPSASLWDQGVYWSAASEDGSDSMPGVYTNPQADVMSSSATAPSDLKASLGGQPNFNYTIHGNENFRPLAVWDNGRFTWIQFRKNVQELPAVFVKDVNGLSIVNYTVHDSGTEIMVNRLMPSFVLRVGREEVTVLAGGR